MKTYEKPMADFIDFSAMDIIMNGDIDDDWETSQGFGELPPLP